MSVQVIKVGGAFLQDCAISKPFFAKLAEVQQHSAVVLVHGGGSSIEQLLAQLQLPSSKIEGLRVTPDSQIDYVVGALAGTVNKRLCGLALQSGLNPVGISLLDGKTTVSRQISPQLGNVGEVIGSNKTLLTTLLASGFLPIVSSIGADASGRILNVNADQAAVAIAKILKASLVLLSDVSGVLDANQQLLPQLNQQQILTLIEQGVIHAGMAVKVRAALEAANTIKQPVTIASWNDLAVLGGTQTTANGAATGGTTIFPHQQELA